MKILKNSNPGFTLIELLIAVTLSSFVFLIVSSIMFTLFNANLRSIDSENIQQVKNDLFVELSNKTRWAKDISIDTDNDILTLDDQIYRLENEQIKKNGETITPSSVSVTEFELRSVNTVAEYPGVEISIGFKDRRNGVTLERMRIYVSNRKTEVDI